MVDLYAVGRNTIDDIPDGERRWELVDGVLILSPSPLWGQSRIASRLLRVLDRALPDEYWVASDTGVSPDAFEYRVPDVVVVRPGDHPDDAVLGPAEVILAVEVVSESSVTNDRITKPAQYAAWGIGAFWRVETEPELSLTAYVLRDGDAIYSEIGHWAEGDKMTVDEPFAVSFQIDELRS